MQDPEAERAGRDTPENVPRRPAPELFRASREMMEAGDLDRSVLLALESLEAKRASPAHFEHAARVLFARGLYVATVLVARRALDFGLDKPAIHIQLARALNRQGDRQGALRHFDAAVELAPENEGFRRFRDRVAARVEAEASAGEEEIDER